MDSKGIHGSVGTRESSFSRLFNKRKKPFNDSKLKNLAENMIGNVGDTANNDPDGEENLVVPAGYTYFGQFVDHDLTFDTTSSLDQPKSIPTDLRTPRLDLDCLYGSGPIDQPYIYEEDKASLRLGAALPGSPGRKDLLRVGERAVIGDPRNDENSIVCNIQLAFIQFHNAVVKHLKDKGVKEGELFTEARNRVRWTYQRIVIEDYLKRVIEPKTYDLFTKRVKKEGEKAFALYKPSKRSGIPIEFAGAAYRFGHSMVRTGYKLNQGHIPQLIFNKIDDQDSLVGFGTLPSNHWIEWKRFFPENNQFKAGERGGDQNVNKNSDRLQWAYRIDTSLVDPLGSLPPVISVGPHGKRPSLASLNLLRGNLFGLVSGQVVAKALKVAPLENKYLVTRASEKGDLAFVSIDKDFLKETPLWFYILAEGQRALVDAWEEKKQVASAHAKLDDDDLTLGIKDKNGDRHQAPIAQLGPVGGRILLETFFGLLLEDAESFLTTDKKLKKDVNSWFNEFTNNVGGKIGFSIWGLLKYAGIVS